MLGKFQKLEANVEPGHGWTGSYWDLRGRTSSAPYNFPSSISLHWTVEALPRRPVLWHDLLECAVSTSYLDSITHLNRWPTFSNITQLHLQLHLPWSNFWTNLQLRWQWLDLNLWSLEGHIFNPNTADQSYYHGKLFGPINIVVIGKLDIVYFLQFGYRVVLCIMEVQ